MRVQPLLIGALFTVAGVAHFIAPATYETIVPPSFGDPARLVAISGAFEIAGGIGATIPTLRRSAGVGLIALLAAVFPANVYMAADRERFAAIPAALLYARLPLQFALAWWVYATCVKPPPDRARREGTGADRP